MMKDDTEVVNIKSGTVNRIRGFGVVKKVK